MKKVIIAVIVTTIVMIVGMVTLLEIIDQMDQLEADNAENIYSEVLAEKRDILIHLPPTYSPSQEYPVMYVLDGTSQDFRIAEIAGLLSRAGVVRDMIIVGIPNTDRNRDLTPHYILQETDGKDFGQGDQFLKFLTNEVIPFIESKYPVNEHRMLAGHSRAGLFTFYAYLEQPDTFDALFCFSPAFWRDDSTILTKAQNFYSSVQSESPFIFMSLGTEENAKMTKAYKSMTNLLDGKAIDNVVHIYTAGANHGNNLYYSTPKALKTWDEHVNSLY